VAATIPSPHTGVTTPLWRRVRTALASAVSQGATMASAARHRLRRPALVIGGLGCMDAAAYQGPLWLGLVVTGASLWVLEWLTGDEPGSSE